jgi:selenide, water dikinase
MQLQDNTPVETDILLLGAGHAHVQVLQAFGMQQQAGIRLTIVTDRLQAPYSGMLPGCIAGNYTPDQIHIDINRLARSVGARMILASAEAIDPVRRQVHLKGRPPIAYDLLSINVGITPDMQQIRGAIEHAVPVKPIADFLNRLAKAQDSIRHLNRPARLTVVGGGAAGIELALALQELHQEQHRAETTLIAGSGIVPSVNPQARKLAIQALRNVGVTIIENDRAAAIAKDHVLCQSGKIIPSDLALVSTNAQLPRWLRESHLTKAENGGLALRSTLQLIDHDSIFAAGDCATMLDDPRPRAGVFAVRQGPILAHNLLAKAQKESLQNYHPQQDFLSILRTGPKSAIASRGRYFAFQGSWIARWKDRIDQQFMDMFRVPDETPDPNDTSMRCGGCAAKVGPTPLRDALVRLPKPLVSKDILVGLDSADDAAVVAWSKNAALVISVDQFRAMLSDPYLFGRIAANHALNDIYAMGGVPHHALALAVLPHNKPSKTSEDLFQLLSGARATLDAANTPLIGGHTSEGETLSLGFSVTGKLGERTLTKSGASLGDHLIITKAIGTGIVFAADMRAMAPSHTVEAMIASMLISNQKAAEILIKQGATAMTDVSGFGLAGHLQEMLANRTLNVNFGADLHWSRIPLSPGVEALADKGFRSSLLADNRFQSDDSLNQMRIGETRSAILYDPQTAGGLLVAVPAKSVAATLKSLHEAGYTSAKDIGVITDQGKIRLVD